MCIKSTQGSRKLIQHRNRASKQGKTVWAQRLFLWLGLVLITTLPAYAAVCDQAYTELIDADASVCGCRIGSTGTLDAFPETAESGIGIGTTVDNNGLTLLSLNVSPDTASGDTSITGTHIYTNTSQGAGGQQYACDWTPGTGYSNPRLLQPNRAPVITSGFGGELRVVFAEENQTAATTITATDPDGDTVSFSLSGTDAARFSINSATGVLTFKTAPDFENPGDANADNDYLVTVTAADNKTPSLSDTKTFTVRVTDVNETPTTGASPSQHPIDFSANATDTSTIKTRWADAIGSKLPDGYIVLCNTVDSFINPVNSVVPTTDTDCSDGTGIQKVAQGTEVATWSGLSLGTPYFFKIFPYAGTGTSTTYKTDGTPPTANETIRSYISPPVLSNLKGTQNGGVSGKLFYQSNGDVTLSFDLHDYDGGNYTYSWVNSHSALLTSGGTPLNMSTQASPVLDITSLPTGYYLIEVSVTDTTAPSFTPRSISQLIEIKTSSSLTTQDSDGDGESDNLEGVGDLDADGIPDYLDPFNDKANLITTDANEPKKYLLKVSASLRVVPGKTSFGAGKTAAKITQEDLEKHGNNGATAVNTRLTDGTLEHLFDYEIDGLAQPADPSSPGYSIPVILPLSTALAETSRFEKYNPVDGWQAFVTDTNNRIEWANWLNNQVGICPGPTDPVYTRTESKAGKNCLRLTLQDGGANDADGIVNGRIIDPFGVVSPASTAVSSSGGGGSLSFMELIIGLLLLFSIRYYYRGYKLQ